MKSYKITCIVENGIRWELDNRSGDYVTRSIGNRTKHIMDFFGDSQIRSIVRISDNQYITVGETFQQGTVTSIFFEKGKPKFRIGTGNGELPRIVGLDEITIFPAARPATRSSAAAIESKPSISREAIVAKITSSLDTRSIRLEKTKKEREETPREFLVKFFTNWNDKKETIYSDTKERQTEAGKRRSFGDIYMIMKYYYPDFQITTLIDLLYKDLPKTLEHFRSSWCNQIKKRTFYYDESEDSGVFNQNKQDEYGFTYNQYLK